MSGLERLWHVLSTGFLPAPPGTGRWRPRSRGIALDPSLVARGWATVDLERTAAELPLATFQPAPDEEALGARALIARAGKAALVLLEPSTEGRLAAALARRGEGSVVMYVIAHPKTPERPRLGAPEAPDLAEPRPTALGRPGRLMRSPKPWGPFVIVVDPA